MKKKVGLMGRRAVYGYLFILPFILGFIFFMIKPLGQSLRMALSDVVISNQGFQLNWNSFANFKKAFLVDSEFNRMLVESISQMFFRSLATIVFSFFALAAHAASSTWSRRTVLTPYSSAPAQDCHPS